MIREYIYFVDDNPNGTSGMTEEEVVRCKDCDNYSECEYDLIKSLENGYCSFGERSE